MATTLLLRSTSNFGVGSFLDMTVDRSVSAFVTGVVGTTSGGTDIQWTATNGGAVIEWVSDTVQVPFTLAGTVTFNIWALESANQANAGGRARLFVRDSGGTETLVAGPADDGTEFGTSAAVRNWTATPTSTAVNAGDRLVVRYYITGVGTMGSGRTCTLHYDGPTASADGDSWVQLTEDITFGAPAGGGGDFVGTGANVVFFLRDRTRLTRPDPSYALNGDSPLSRGLVGCWPIHDGNGPQCVKDITRFRRHGVSDAGGVGVGRRSKPFILGGRSVPPSEQILVTGLQTSFVGPSDFGLPFSVACWSRMGAIPGGTDIRVQNEVGTNVGIIDSQIFVSVGSSANVGITATPFALYHIALTWDGSRVIGYVNGKPVGFDDTGDYAGQITQIVLGSGGSDSSDANVSFVSLWNRALTPPEVAALFDYRTRWDLIKPRRIVGFSPPPPPTLTFPFTRLRTQQSRFTSSRRPPEPYQVNRSSSLSRGLVGLWPVIGGIGLQAFKDVSGNGFHGDVDSGVKRPGVSVPAPSIGGRMLAPGHLVQTLSFPPIVVGQPWTVSFWFSFEVTPSSSTQIFPINNGFTIEIDNSLGIFLSGTTSTTSVAAGLAKKVMHHVVCAYDGSNIETYVNGIPYGAQAWSPSADMAWLSVTSSSAAGGAVTSVAQVALWRRRLSGAEAKSMWDPRTRWDIYLQSQKFVSMPASAAPTTNLLFLVVGGAVALAGAIVRAASNRLTGTQAPTGLLSKYLPRALAGTAASAGALNKQAQPAYAGASSPAGAAVFSAVKAATGAIAPAGTMAKAVARQVAGAVISAGALYKAVSNLVSGTIASAGAPLLERLRLQTFTGDAATAGSTANTVNNSLAGAVAPTGALTQTGIKALIATIATSGVLAIQRFYQQTLSGTIALAGIFTIQAQKTLSGTISLAGAVYQFISSLFASTVALAGSVYRQGQKFYTGALATVGALYKLVLKAIIGSISLTGSLTTQQSAQSISLSGVIASASTLAKTASKTVAGAATPTGSLVRVCVAAYTAAITVVGSLYSLASKLVAGSISSSGVLTLSNVVLRTLTGTAALAGSLTLSAIKLLVGAVASTSSLTRSALKAAAGALSPAGDLYKFVSQSIAGAISSSGLLATIKVVLRTLTGTAISSGSLAQQANKAPSGTVASSGAVTRAASKLWTGTIAPVGFVSKLVSKLIVGSISPTGVFSIPLTRTFTGVVATAGLLTNQANKLLTATQSSAGTIAKFASKLMAGALAPSGLVSKLMDQSVSGSISPSGLLTRIITFARTFAGAVASAGSFIYTIGQQVFLPGAKTHGVHHEGDHRSVHSDDPHGASPSGGSSSVTPTRRSFGLRRKR